MKMPRFIEESRWYDPWKLPEGKSVEFSLMTASEANNKASFPDDGFTIIEDVIHEFHNIGKKPKITVGCIWRGCPFCNKARSYYDNDETYLGNEFYKKTHNIFNALIVKDETGMVESGTVKIIKLDRRIFEKMDTSRIIRLTKVENGYEVNANSKSVKVIKPGNAGNIYDLRPYRTSHDEEQIIDDFEYVMKHI